MWMRGEKFQNILRLTDTDEGEVVRYFRMSIQILREMADSQASSYILRDRIKNAIRLINRDVVDAEKQLREG
jgi:superfamily II RNA helicase